MQVVLKQALRLAGKPKHGTSFSLRVSAGLRGMEGTGRGRQWGSRTLQRRTKEVGGEFVRQGAAAADLLRLRIDDRGQLHLVASPVSQPEQHTMQDWGVYSHCASVAFKLGWHTPRLSCLRIGDRGWR